MSSRVSVALLVLVHVALHEGPLAAAALFPAYDLLSQLATLLTDIVPVGIKIWMDVAISFDRIQVIIELQKVGVFFPITIQYCMCILQRKIKCFVFLVKHLLNNIIGITNTGQLLLSDRYTGFLMSNSPRYPTVYYHRYHGYVLIKCGNNSYITEQFHIMLFNTRFSETLI